MINLLDENLIITISIAIFVYLGYRPIRKLIVSSLDHRINEIELKLRETENLKKDAQIILDKIKHEIAGFEDKKKSILESAHVSTERFITTKVKEIDIALARKQELAIKCISQNKVKTSKKMSTEFTNKVLKLVETYLAETKNNSVSDQQIIAHLLKIRF